MIEIPVLLNLNHLLWLRADYRDRSALPGFIKRRCRISPGFSTLPGDLNFDVATELHDNVVDSLSLFDLCLEKRKKTCLFILFICL